MTVLSLHAPPVTGTGLRKAFAILVAVLAVGAALYLSPAVSPTPAAATERPQKPAPAPRAVEAANAFLASLDDSQRGKALYDFASNKKPNWSNLPVTMVPRNGVRLGDLTEAQRTKAMAVLAAVLSKTGYQKVVDILDGDQQLVDRQAQGRGGPPAKGGNRAPMFGKDQYYLALFGRPSESQPWMIQFGGHHLGLNVTVVGKHFILTPTHTGAQPTLFKRGGIDVRPLGRERDTADKLIASLNQQLRSQAVIAARPQGELLLGPGRDGKTIEPRGIKGSALTQEQHALLIDVIATWIDIVDGETTTARMAAIRDKIGETYFAWSGPTEPGQAAYFRIQGPSVVIEYAPQGSTDHIHTVIRNPEDDYGVGSIKP